MRGPRVVLLASALTISAIVLAAPAATAAGEIDVEVVGGGPLFDLEDLAPGMTGAREVSVTNRSDDDAELFVRVVDLVEDDNGCNRPEERAGDTTCGMGGGELGADLLITVSDGAAVLFAGPLRELTSAQLLGDELAPGEHVTLTFAYEFDFASGNETQTDRVGFDVEIGLSQVVRGGGSSVSAGSDEPAETGGLADATPAGTRAGVPAGQGGTSPEVGGVVQARAATTVAGAALPRSGAEPLRFALAGVALVAIGAVVRHGRRIGPRPALAAIPTGRR